MPDHSLVSSVREGFTRYFDRWTRVHEAERVILTLDEREVGVTSNLITRLIKERQPAPMRYMM